MTDEGETREAAAHRRRRPRESESRPGRRGTRRPVRHAPPLPSGQASGFARLPDHSGVRTEGDEPPPRRGGARQRPQAPGHTQRAARPGVGKQALVTRRHCEPDRGHAFDVGPAPLGNKTAGRQPARATGQPARHGHANGGGGGTYGPRCPPWRRAPGLARGPCARTASAGRTESAGEGRPDSAGQCPSPGADVGPGVSAAWDPGHWVTRASTPCPRRACRSAAPRGPGARGRLIPIPLSSGRPVRASAFCHECIMGSFS